MKLVSLYLLRALGVSLLFAVCGLALARFAFTPRYSDDRLALVLICTSVLLALQVVTLPFIVWKKNGKTRLTAQMIHDEQLRLLFSCRDFFRRHRTFLLIAFIGGLIALVLFDSFAK